MKLKIKITILALGIFAALISFNACSDAEGSNEKTEDAVRAVSVETSPIVGTSYTDYIPVLGSIKAYQNASLSSTEGGRIKKIVRDKGYSVSKGDTIIIIDNDVLKASLDAAKAQYEIDDMTFLKQEQIYKENINSEYEYLQSKFRRDQSKANYDLINARYGQTFITATFDGIVDKRFYEVGEFAPPAVPIVDIISKNKFKVSAGVPERYVGQIKVGQNCRVYLKTVSEAQLDGIISYVGASIETDNRTFPIEVTVLSKSDLLKPELVAEVLIDNGEYQNVVKIPDEIVSRVDNGYIVYTVENNTAHAKQIEILSRFGDQIAVKSGLKEGEQLIVVGYQNLVEGQKVNVVNGESN